MNQLMFSQDEQTLTSTFRVWSNPNDLSIDTKITENALERITQVCKQNTNDKLAEQYFWRWWGLLRSTEKFILG